MASASPAFGTNNPFRRKSGSPSFSAATTTTAAALSGGSPAPSASLDHGDGPFAPAAPRPPLTTFRSASYDDYHGRDGGPVQPKPKKIVKKVRVQSPPPSSPEDAVPVTTRYPPIDYDDDASSVSSASRDEDDDDGGRADPFNAELADGDAEHYIAGQPPLSRPPPNPFSKAPGHLENSAPDQESGSASGGARGGLDVDSFRRLLLTGYANTPGPGGQSGNTGVATGPGHDGASTTDASSVSRQSIVDATQETPRTSHEISDAEENGERRGIHPSSPLSTIQSTSGRKKPPPPSSRHGKLIKIELGAEAARDPRRPASIDTALPVARQSTPPSASDVNKPLPLPPNRRTEDGTESPFDREAAGKLPEALADLATHSCPPTPPAGTRSRSESQVSTGTTSSMRKPAAPPPRRPGLGQGRTEAQASPQVASPSEEDPPRGSMDSSRSRTESFRGVAAPAPPPPRRPAHGRSASSVLSPSGSSFVSLSSLGGSDGTSSPKGAVPDQPQAGGAMATVTTSKDGLPKLSPPPPPPARHSSTRRQPSISSTEMGGRRASKEKEGGGARPPPPPPRGRGGSRGNAGKPVTDPAGFATPTGAGADILKDLETLQRELNAAMGSNT